ncbi:MAG: PLP-dependent aminotransferase family protein, partial [Clostridia bacterium]|nr:PLP-dependent aminotransferase family protein [Clostridia bacterium]
MEYIFSNRISSLKPSAIREILKATSQPGVIPFAAGNPSVEAFPIEEVKKISEEILRENPVAALQYGISEGYQPLRNRIMSYMKEKHNVSRDFDNIIITSGAQQVMDLTTKIFINEGDTVVCETPSFIGSLNCFRSYKANLCGVPVESDGMNIEKLEEALKNNKNVKFIYTIPNFQNPSGITMSLEKRKAVYELAKKYNVLILEDN